MLNKSLSPEAAVDALTALHATAVTGLKTCLERYFTTRQPPTAAERQGFRYPELAVHYESHGIQPSIARAYAKFQGPGTYVTTIAHPAHFKPYL
ncbi:MAG: AMP nucleosidase, partial [Aestuariivirga sp.]